MKYPVVVLSAFLITVTASEAVAGCAYQKWACGMSAKEKCNGPSDHDRVAQCLEEANSDCEAQDQACVNALGKGSPCLRQDPMVIGEQNPRTTICRERRFGSPG
jgi:hypothetical protein